MKALQPRLEQQLKAQEVCFLLLSAFGVPAPLAGDDGDKGPAGGEIEPAGEDLVTR